MKHTENVTDFEFALLRQSAKSELVRVSLLAVTSGVLLAYSLTIAAFFPDLLGAAFQKIPGTAATWFVPLALAALVVYAFGVRALIRQNVTAGRILSMRYRYGTAAFEALYPTLLIFVLSPVADPVFLLVSPVVLLYGVFIVSTTLQMDPKTPIIASILAASGYLAAYLLLRGTVDAREYPAWLLTPNGYAGRALLLILIGLIGSFIAWQIRKRVIGLMAATEEKNRIRQTFGQHVSPQVVDRLLQQQATTSSEMRHVCVMFLDIRNFTTLSESRSPEEVVAILNELFSFMIDITNRHDGIINKFLGDGYMAVFGAPLSGERNCANAVSASREILAHLEADNEERHREISVGIGLHAGRALTGDVGSEERKEYTVIGDVVNVAARIEQLNKQYDSRVLLSDAVYNELPENGREFTDMGSVQVKGRDAAVRLYKMA